MNPLRVGAFSLGLFVVLTLGVVSGITSHFDTVVNGSMVLFEATIITQSMTLITLLGAGWYLLAELLLVMGLLSWLRKWRRMVWLLVSFIISKLVGPLLKAWIARPRPTNALLALNGFSYPSGHALGSAVVFGGVICAFWDTRYRWPVLAVAAPLLVLIGLSRIYLRVHWFTDVVGSWLLAVGILGLVAWLVEQFHKFYIRQQAGFSS